MEYCNLAPSLDLPSSRPVKTIRYRMNRGREIRKPNAKIGLAPFHGKGSESEIRSLHWKFLLEAAVDKVKQLEGNGGAPGLVRGIGRGGIVSGECGGWLGRRPPQDVLQVMVWNSPESSGQLLKIKLLAGQEQMFGRGFESFRRTLLRRMAFSPKLERYFTGGGMSCSSRRSFCLSASWRSWARRFSCTSWL